MMGEKDLQMLGRVSPAEGARFRLYLESHPVKSLEMNDRTITYLSCGAGRWTLLTFAGGWGGTELAYDFVLGFEDRNRVLVIDIGVFAEPDEMADGINRVLEREKAGSLVVVGQSLAGIIGQAYFRRHFDKVDGLILTNTLSLRPEHSRRWALALLAILPMSLLKKLLRRKMTRLGDFREALPPDVRARRQFATALLGCMAEGYWTKKGLFNVLKLVMATNARDGYTRDSFPGWQGEALVVTSPDDPYYPDAGRLLETLPNARKHEFPGGYGHTAPMIFRDEYHALIQQFIDGLGGGTA
ncbi:MAG: alpha/beta hydrolase [Acidobacteria bacterium]|nr:alpha/beta hydrolase [Acidobacteriota bacterium]